MPGGVVLDQGRFGSPKAMVCLDFSHFYMLLYPCFYFLTTETPYLSVSISWVTVYQCLILVKISWLCDIILGQSPKKYAKKAFFQFVCPIVAFAVKRSKLDKSVRQMNQSPGASYGQRYPCPALVFGNLHECEAGQWPR